MSERNHTLTIYLLNKIFSNSTYDVNLNNEICFIPTATIRDCRPVLSSSKVGIVAIGMVCMQFLGPYQILTIEVV